MISKGIILQVENAPGRDHNGVSVRKFVQVFPSDEDGNAACVCVAAEAGTGLVRADAAEGAGTTTPN